MLNKDQELENQIKQLARWWLVSTKTSKVTLVWLRKESSNINREENSVILKTFKEFLFVNGSL